MRHQRDIVNTYHSVSMPDTKYPRNDIDCYQYILAGVVQ